MIENSQQQRQTGAAVESFRNEMVKSNEVVKILTSKKPLTVKMIDFIYKQFDLAKPSVKGGNMKATGAGFMDMFPVLKLITGGDMKAVNSLI